MSKRFFERGVAPLIPLLISAAVLISAMAVTLFTQKDTRTYRSSAAHPTSTPIKTKTPTKPPI